MELVIDFQQVVFFRFDLCNEFYLNLLCRYNLTILSKIVLINQ